MKKILICAKRPWSLSNILPAIKTLSHVDIHYWDFTKNIPLPPHQYCLIITCEPHVPEWIAFYKQYEGDINMIALQQGLYWHPKVTENSTWAFDKYLVWGEQMKECCIKNKLNKNKIIATGCPKHDDIFKLTPVNNGHILLLNDAWDTLRDYEINTSIKYSSVRTTLHPCKTEHKEVFNTLEYVRTATAVVCGETGCGIWAMILKKPFIAVSKKQKRHDYDKSKVLNIKEFSTDYDDYLQWAITGDGAIEKVQKVINWYI